MKHGDTDLAAAIGHLDLTEPLPDANQQAREPAHSTMQRKWDMLAKIVGGEEVANEWVDDVGRRKKKKRPVPESSDDGTYTRVDNTHTHIHTHTHTHTHTQTLSQIAESASVASNPSDDGHDYIELKNRRLCVGCCRIQKELKKAKSNVTFAPVNARKGCSLCDKNICARCLAIWSHECGTIYQFPPSPYSTWADYVLSLPK